MFNSNPQIKSAFNVTILSFFSLFLIVLLVFYSFRIEPSNINKTQTSLDFDLLNPIKIIFISDIHSDVVSQGFLTEVVRLINEEEPDYIFLGGDFISNKDDNLSKLSPLSGLRAKKGKYAVIGNHDYDIWDQLDCSLINKKEITENISTYLEGIGIRVLKNEAVELDKELVLIGLDDFWSCKSDYQSALQGIREDKTRIILTHNQDSVPKQEIEKIHLILAGHTHCGQVRLPFFGSIPKTFYNFSGDYEMGLHKFDNNSYIYTTCGIGGKPRFLAPPEITIIQIS
jgi:predicted MPP superfamily phosphohydrolase